MPRPLLSFLLLLALLCANAPARAGDAPTLRLLVVAGNTMPLAQVEGETVRAGLLKDLGERVAREAGMSVAFVVMPRGRVAAALLQGQADMLCDTLPEWVPEAAQFLWSEPVIWNPQYLVSAAPHPAPGSWPQLGGSTLVMMRGYRYPKPLELAQGLERGQWTRSDAPSQEAILRRLQLGRGDYGVIGELPLNWFLRQHPQARFNKGLTVIDQPTRCMLARRPDLPAERLLHAIERLGARGELARLAEAYRPR